MNVFKNRKVVDGKPIAPRHCPHTGLMIDVPFDVDGAPGGYHLKCQDCQMLLKTNMYGG